MFNRILKGVIASFYGQGVTILFQFLSVPLFITCWGIDGYGQWLTIFAIPMTLTMLDFGFFNILGNKISNALQAQNKTNACDIINVTFLSLILIGIILIVIVVFVCEYIGTSCNLTLWLALITYSILLLVANFFVNIFRANREYHIGSFLTNTARLIENACVLLYLFTSPSMLNVSILYLVSRLVTSIFIFIFFKEKNRWYELKIRSFKCINITDIKDSFSYALMPIAFMLNNQGIIFLLNSIVGSAQVAIFVTARTYFRVINNVVTALTNSTWQEINYTANEGNKAKLASIMNKLNKFTVGASILCGCILMAIFEFILQIWTHGEITISFHNSVMIMLSVVFFSLWQPYHIFLSAVGDYRIHTKAYFILQVLLISFSYLLGVGFELFLMTSIFVEVVMLMISHIIYIRRFSLI